MSRLNSSSYIVDMTVGQTFSCKNINKINMQIKQTVLRIAGFSLLWSYLPTSLDDFVINVGDDHGMDDSDSKQLGQNPLQDVKPDIRAGTRQAHGYLASVRRGLQPLACTLSIHVRVNTMHDPGGRDRTRWVHSCTWDTTRDCVIMWQCMYTVYISSNHWTTLRTR